MATILLQWSILLILAAGWGYGITLALRTSQTLRLWWAYVACAGLCLPVIIVQDLLYLDVPVKYSAWIVFVPGLISSSILAWRALRHSIRPGKTEWLNVFVAVALSAVVYGIPIVTVGPPNYYGTAHEDQVNYVTTAQFLKDQPFSTKLTSPETPLWLVKAMKGKEQRIGAEVCIAIVATVSGTDAQTAYGSTTVFFILLLSATSYGAIRGLALPRWTATLCAIWICLLPSLTRLQLDGFLSNVSVLFCFPLLCGVLASERAIGVGEVAVSSIAAAYVLSCYSEVYPLMMLMAGALIVVKRGRLWARLGVIAAVLTGSCFLLPLYLPLAARFVTGQLGAAANPNALAGIFPHAGSLQGWGEIFMLPRPIPNLPGWSTAALMALLTLFLGCCAFLSHSVRRRIRLLAVMVVPSGVLLLMLGRVELNGYPFAKLSQSFAWLWCGFAALGLARLTMLMRPKLRIGVMAAFLSCGILAAMDGTWSQLHSVINNDGILASVNSPAVRSAYDFVELHPERTYVIQSPDNILATWLSFHARHSRVYIGSIPDPETPAKSQVVLQQEAGAVLLTPFGFRDVRTYVGLPELIVHNPQGRDAAGQTEFFWVGKNAELEVTGYNRSAEMETYRLTFWAGAGPANPSQHRVLEIAGDAGSKVVQNFDSAARISVLLGIRRGHNLFRLTVLEPQEQVVFVPRDPRNHMIRIQEFSFSPVPLNTAVRPVVIGAS